MVSKYPAHSVRLAEMKRTPGQMPVAANVRKDPGSQACRSRPTHILIAPEGHEKYIATHLPTTTTTTTTMMKTIPITITINTSIDIDTTTTILFPVATWNAEFRV